MASSEGRPSQVPPSASPWPMRKMTSATMAVLPTEA